MTDQGSHLHNLQYVKPYHLDNSLKYNGINFWSEIWNNVFSYCSFAITVSQLKIVIFQEKRLKVLKCCTFLWVQWRHKCFPVAGLANCVMTLYLLKVHLWMFHSIPVTQKCQILSCDTLVANERYMKSGW